MSEYWTKKDFFGVVRASAIIPTALLMLLSCADLEQRYIKQDKLFKIALIEDSRINDTLLTGDYFLSDPDPDIRARAAQAAGRIGGNFYSRVLKNNLRDSISAVAEAKYFAAGLTGDSSLFDSLFDLAQSDPMGRKEAVEALGRIASVEQATKLATFLTDRDSIVVYQAILAMWRTDEWSQASMIADMGRLSGNRLIKYGTLYSLARSGKAEGRELFLGLLSDPDPEFRMLAYSGLGRSADTASIKQIAGGLNDADRRVVASAMNALRRFGDWGSISVCEKLRA